jgi:fluoroquinolone transport system permease protein
MLQLIHIKNDIRQILRDPIMAIMLVVPVFVIVLFKLMVLYLMPALIERTLFDANLYSDYIMAFVLVINSGTLGIVTGFMMLDERDGNIAELMSVTPLGRSGYLINRLMFASILSVVYCIAACYVINLAVLPWYSILFLALLSGLYSANIGLLIFSGADDKVKGLTFAKALNALVVFALADIVSLPWLTTLSWFFPPYWVTMVIKSPQSWEVFGLALLVHAVWLWLLIWSYWRKRA